jgi:hypothetical protein
MLVTNIIIELELTKYIVTFKNNYEKLSIILNIKKKVISCLREEKENYLLHLKHYFIIL